MNIRRLALIVVFCSAQLGSGRAGQVEDMFPFVIPGMDVPPAGSVVDMAWLNDRPAGKDGFVRVREGKFVDGRGKRVRFLASNVTFASCFPDHETADRLASRFASLGINCIRFHHTDNHAAPRGIWKAGTTWKNEFDPTQLDRLDYFIAALKRHGVFANLNLHISRNYWEGEPFPDGLANNRERQELLPNYGKGIDKINDQMIRMQRDYARALLTHVNAYTRTSYAQEPAVAMVEINNENSLLQLKVSSLPEYYRADVMRKWNAWLKARFTSTPRLNAAWGGDEPRGTNLLPTTTSVQGAQYLTVRHGSPDEITVSVLKVPEISWHAQVHWPGLSLEAGQLYTVEFSARSELPRRVALSTRLNKADWHNCGLSEEVELTSQWRDFSFTFRAVKVEPDAVRLDLVAGGGPAGDFTMKNVSLRQGGSPGLKPGETLEAGTIQAPARTPNSARGLAWTSFLAETERAYTDGMREFLKNGLGVQAAIIDTQASYGGIAGTFREALNDYVDMHAYWQHPSFPGRPWDSSNWRIRNTPMVDDKSGGNLARLAAFRVAGKPFTVSEYDHPAPSHYAAEMFPMIASFAALQDWDGLFQFDWGGTDADARRITGFFSLQQHPAKLAFMPAAALMFRRGDVAPAEQAARLEIPLALVDELTANNVSMAEAWQRGGFANTNLLRQRLELRFTRHAALRLDSTKAPGARTVTWDAEASIYTVDTPAAKAIVGRCTGKVTRLAGAEFQLEPNSWNFAVLSLNAADGKPVRESSRLLLVAVGNVENKGMGWNEDHTTVGTNWGTAPTVCEGISGKVKLATVQKQAKVYALDGSGGRAQQLPSTISDGQLTFEIGPPSKTIWYEISGAEP